MVFTVLLNIIMVFISIAVILIHNDSQELMRNSFDGSIENKMHLFMNAFPEVMSKYCEGELNNLMKEAKIVLFFSNILIFNMVGNLTSVLQKFLVYKFKDNVTLPLKQMFLEGSIGFVGVVFMIMYNTTQFNTLITDECSQWVDIDKADTDTINRIFTMRYPLENQVSFKFIISVIVIQCTMISVLMLQRTRFLGELIMMLGEMFMEMVRFFVTFSLIIGLFVLIGRMLLHEVKKDKFYIFIDLFDAINGNQNFDNFTKPVGQVYIASFMYIFRVLFISLLAAMFINKYQTMFT